MLKRMVVPILFGLIGAAILISLGMWQTQRLVWKQAILARIEARIHADPVALPAATAEDADIQFLNVRASGRFTGDEVHVLASTKDYGPVYRIIAAFETDSGRRILVDRGIVAHSKKQAARPALDAVITGNIRTPDEVDNYTPAPDRQKNIWFARDVPEIAQVLTSEPILVVLRETSETDLAVSPLPVDTSGIPNNHLNYAITWFLFALAWLGMTGYWLWRIRRHND
jgi:surfeit locus 1 family protein